ncbi:coiled-coil domain-containing protein 34-like isoform X4 [Dendropsophus ebraccatus]|uniref:coiled-coil domain-containing protein 34-like isoform X4 n=1 Tax=Dendropsophus ebraccatus TaxID=150705 RepID=UPI0038316E52
MGPPSGCGAGAGPRVAAEQAMSSTTSDVRSAEVRLSHSTPQKPSTSQPVMGRSKSCDISSAGESTYSLLSPIYHDSFESDIEDHSFHADILAEENETKKPSNQNQGGVSAIEQSLADLKLSPWETWLLSKERQGRIELQSRIAEELKQEEERRKQELKKEQKKLLAEEQHKEWVRKKQEQEEEEKRIAEQREKKEKAEYMFEEWLEQAKNKPRPTLNSYGYVNGKLTGYYDASSYPAPGFYNPIPWKPIPMPPPPKETIKTLSGKKKKRPVSHQLYRPSTTIGYKPKDNLQVGGGMFRR